MTKKTDQLNPEMLYAKYSFRTIEHSEKRLSQRGLTEEVIQLALDYSDSFHRQGMMFHVVMNKWLPDNLHPDLARKLKNLVIIIKNGVLKTCYKNCDSIKYVKKKTKRLTRFENVA